MTQPEAGSLEWLKEPPGGVLSASQIQLDTLLADLLPASAAVPTQAHCVLLTGPTGFLGRFLMLELLQQVPPGGEVICVGRASNDAVARERVLQTLRVSPQLGERLTRLEQTRRLTILAGDVSRPRLGLSEVTYARVCAEADTVVHNAALVNHALPFAAVVDANVLGCLNLLRVALRGPRKAFNYVSTAGVIDGVRRPGPIREDETASSLWPERVVNAGYAAGYVSSKWVCEVLLETAHRGCQLPVNIFRPSMIMPSVDAAGQVNLPDVFNRFLITVVRSALAPPSWYAPGSSGHFDGTPVDWVARGMAAVAGGVRDGMQRYHVAAPGDAPPAGMDHFVVWTREAGYPIRHTTDHAEWYRRCMAFLQSLPPAVRRTTLYPLMAFWELPTHDFVRPDTSLYTATLAQLGQNSRPPPVDGPYIAHCLKQLVALGSIPSPPA